MSETEIDPKNPTKTITVISYEEWKQLPGAYLSGHGAAHPEWFVFGVDADGKPRARMTKDGTDALLVAIEQETKPANGAVKH